MKNKWNQRIAVLAAIACVLVMSMNIREAIAYFTTYVAAEGGKELDLGFTTTIPHENKGKGSKLITIENTGEKECYVRVTAFAGSKHTLNFIESSHWKKKGDYYYFTEILLPHTSTETLELGIVPGEIEADSFDVIVVQECTPVPYDEQGETVPWDQVDWNRTADVVKTEITNEIPMNPETPKEEDKGEEH